MPWRRSRVRIPSSAFYALPANRQVLAVRMVASSPQIVAGTTREYQTPRVVDARARAETRTRQGSSVDLDLSRGFEIVQTRRGSRLSSTQTRRRPGRARIGKSWHRIRTSGHAELPWRTKPSQVRRRTPTVSGLCCSMRSGPRRSHAPYRDRRASVRRSAGRVHARSRCSRPHLRGPHSLLRSRCRPESVAAGRRKL